MAAIEVPGLKFPEGPRWHESSFWFSDQLGDNVWRVGEDGVAQVVCALDRPSGLGFPSSGGVLVALMRERRVVRVFDGDVQTAFDLSMFGAQLNDMVIDRLGRVYVDVYGDDLRENAALVVICPGAAPRLAAPDLNMPNGVAVTPDGDRLLVSETFAERVTAFDVAPDGSLANRTTWAHVPGMFPDGLCLDESGAIWVASYSKGEFLRLAEGGRVFDRIAYPGRWALSCALGGDDGRTLLLCTAEATMDGYVSGDAKGFVETRRVDVAGVGCP